jgi:transposase
MGRRLQIEWQESANELATLYKNERNADRRSRLLALYHLRRGKRIQDVVEILNVSYRSVQHWVAWYRTGGLDEVLRRIRGHNSSGGHRAYLTDQQQRALLAKVQLGDFRTVWDAVQWVKDRWGVRYTYKGMHDLLYRHDCRPKVPRPQSEKADAARQDAWKKGAWRKR